MIDAQHISNPKIEFTNKNLCVTSTKAPTCVVCLIVACLFRKNKPKHYK